MDYNAQPDMTLTERQKETVHKPNQDWSDDFALKVAVADFQRAEAFRTSNHDWRWRNAEEIYLAWVKQLYWEGTRIPRASMGVYVAYEQVESFLPKIMGAIFGDNPWFQADPAARTSIQEARDVAALVADQLDQCDVKDVARRAIKSALIYGDGIVELTWNMSKIEKRQTIPSWRPTQTDVGNSLMGAHNVPTGFERVLTERNFIEIENRPGLKYRSIKDCYVDPNCESPKISDARFFAYRNLMTVDAVSALGGTHSEFKIPRNDVLIDLSRQKSSTQGDQSKSAVEMMRYGWWNPIVDQTVDPGGQRLEIIAYWTDDRLVWVANRKIPILNIKNPYGFKPWYHVNYTDVLDRFYGLSICDVTEGEQRLQQSTLNARIDEMALNIHRPVIKRRGISTPAYQLRQRPGQMIEADNPKEDFFFPDPPAVMAQAFIEVQASEARVQKTTGGSDLAMLGTASSGGNSASRTATGVGVQANATASRINYLVENAENYFIEPMLNDLVKMNQMFPPLGSVPLRGGRSVQSETVVNSNVRLFMRASARMKSQMALLQTFPLVIQTMLNPEFLMHLERQGKTIDADELMRILSEMTGYKNRAALIREMTAQERQMSQQPPAQEQIRMQMQRERLTAQQQMNQQKLGVTTQLAASDRRVDLVKALAGHATKVLDIKSRSEQKSSD